MSEEALLEKGAGEGTLVRRLILFVVFVNLIATSAGGYFLVGRYEVKLYQTGTELARYQSNLVLIESEIKELELAHTKLKAEYEARNERLAYGLDMVRLMNEAKPKMRVRIVQKGINVYPKTIEVMYSFENVGKYDITPEMLELYLFDAASEKPIPLHNLKLGGGLTIPAGSSIWFAAEFSKQGLNRNKVYRYELKYKGSLSKEMGGFIESVIRSGGHKLPRGLLEEVGTIRGTISI